MAYRVVQWGTGAVGSESIRTIVANPGLELVGCLVYAEEKDGVDAGVIAGIGPLGVPATRDRDAILALDADCVFYTAAMAWDGALTFEQNDRDVVDILTSGKNVISILAGHVWPEIRGRRFADALDTACATGGSTLYGTGVHPGFAVERIGATLTGLCEQVSSVTVREVWDCTASTSEIQMLETIGFGKPAAWLEDAPLIPILTAWMHEALLSAAASTGRTLDGFDRAYEYGLTTKDVRRPFGIIPEGTLGAVGWTWTGLVGGEPFVTATTRWVADWDIEGWQGEQGKYWEYEIVGTPGVKARVTFEDTLPPVPGVPGGTDRVLNAVAVASALNVIPEVVGSAPGILRASTFGACRA